MPSSQTDDEGEDFEEMVNTCAVHMRIYDEREQGFLDDMVNKFDRGSVDLTPAQKGWIRALYKRAERRRV